MYITAILSNLGAWDRLQKEYKEEYENIVSAISRVQPEKTKGVLYSSGKDRMFYSPIEISRDIQFLLSTQGWNKKRYVFGKSPRRFTEIHAIKHDVGVDISFGKFAFAESDIFVKFPLFIQTTGLKIAVLILATKFFSKSMGIGVGDFEMVSDRIIEISPLAPKYPFLIIGISDEPNEFQVQELTSALDSYLIETVGYTLLEMKMQSERPNYDFKVQLPSDNQKIAKEICALANNKNGGLILVGVDDEGTFVDFLEMNLTKCSVELSKSVRKLVNLPLK